MLIERQKINREVVKVFDDFERERNGGLNFVLEFSERIVEELREFSDGCKKGAQRVKKLIVDLEEFYLKVKKRENDFPLAPTTEILESEHSSSYI